MANISDKEQADIERAADDSAIRMQHFDGKEVQEGETKFQSGWWCCRQSQRRATPFRRAGQSLILRTP